MRTGVDKGKFEQSDCFSINGVLGFGGFLVLN